MFRHFYLGANSESRHNYSQSLAESWRVSRGSCANSEEASASVLHLTIGTFDVAPARRVVRGGGAETPRDREITAYLR